jgi:hypothetical protein
VISRRALAIAFVAAPLSCVTTPPEAKVWSSSSSSDGFAGCPSGTSVVGGGFEMVDAVQVPGKLPHVVASKPYGNGWRVTCTDDTGAPTSGCRAWVVCASILR